MTGIRGEATQRTRAVLTLRSEALAEGREQLVHKLFPSDRGSIAEVADLASEVIGLRQLSAPCQDLKRLIPRDAVAVNIRPIPLRCLIALSLGLFRDSEEMASPATESLLGW